MVRIILILVLGLLFIGLASVDTEAAFLLGKNGPKIKGFVEFSFGAKLGEANTKRDTFNMLEERLQLKTNIYPKFPSLFKRWAAEVNFKGDFLVDEYFSGKTDFDLRQLNIAFTPLSWSDIKIGRQVFTWGTGDYLFINDLFPKDYISFYIGRDDEYLKKPSDGIRVSIYSKDINLDVVIIPVFEPNAIFSGDRLSFFDSFQGGIAARDSDRYLKEPARQFDNSEYATRIYRNFGSYEAAIYTFRGFYKMPRGYLDEANRILFYPRLDVYGTSIRGPILGGIASFEFGYYNSRQDRNGDNRLIDNSMLKYLMGYDKDLGNDLTIGIQYLYERILNYAAYRDALMDTDFRWDEHRHLTTLRLTKLFKSQTVKAGLFVFFSPSDQDIYLRPGIDYDVSDNLRFSLGANIIWGRDDHTEFGQMEKNKNIYLRLRYSF
jgi:hypothetical protein